MAQCGQPTFSDNRPSMSSDHVKAQNAAINTQLKTTLTSSSGTIFFAVITLSIAVVKPSNAINPRTADAWW